MGERKTQTVLQDTDGPSVEEAKDRSIEQLSSLCKPHNRSHALSVIITQPWVKDPRNLHKQKDPGAQGRQAVHAWGGSGDDGFRLSMAGRTGLH